MMLRSANIEDYRREQGWSRSSLSRAVGMPAVDEWQREQWATRRLSVFSAIPNNDWLETMLGPKALIAQVSYFKAPSNNGKVVKRLNPTTSERRFTFPK